MKIKITQSFRIALQKQVEYIAKDKPLAARKFKNDILDQLRNILLWPYKYRRSVFFDRDDIRDLVVKGYIIVYKINETDQTIEVFGFTAYQDNPFPQSD